MPAPYELRWGKGFEDRDYRKIAKGILVDSIDIVLEEGTHAFGLDYSRRKTLVVSEPNPKEKVWARCTGASTIWLYMSQRDLRRTDRTIHSNAATIFHEDLHSERRHVHGLATMLELASSEGVAYNSEALFSAHVSQKTSINGVVAKARCIPDEEVISLRSRFLPTCSDPEQWTENVHHQWFEKRYRPHKLSVGELVGVRAVGERIEEGRSLGELIEMTGLELLEAEEYVDQIAA